MSDLLDVEVQLYPELLRRLAAGERLASAGDEQEKIAATALVVEAIEHEKKAQNEKPEKQIEKKALLPELLAMGAGLALAGPAKKMIQTMRGEPAIPEQAQELMKSFRRILEERAAAESARRKLLLTGIGGAAAGALAVKALEKKEDSKAAEEKPSEKKADGGDVTGSNDVTVSNTASDGAKKPDEGSPGAKALLDRVLKHLQ